MVSIDGYFEGPAPGQIDWFRADEELENYIHETQDLAGTLLFGRVTYEMMAAYWQAEQDRIADFMNNVEKVVFSETLSGVSWTNTRLVKNNVLEVVTQLKQQPGGDIFVMGSADFTATLMQYGLVDEYRLGINPVILGKGTPLFKEGLPRQDLALAASRTLASGLVILHYLPVTAERYRLV
jgi:dihydrofolate reductase